MATTAITVICRCTSPVASTCCAAVCGAPTPTLADGAVDELAPLVAQIRQRWPDTKILVRGDSGFCREEIMAWCERQGVDFVLGLARNARLHKRTSTRRCARAATLCGEGRRRGDSGSYALRTLKSWSRRRRVVAKAEWLAGARGGNPEPASTGRRYPSRPSEELYCARGDMENRIKEQPVAVRRPHFGGYHARQSVAAVLRPASSDYPAPRRSEGNRIAAARFDTIRSRLIKLAGRIKVSVRRVRSRRRYIRCRFAQALTALRAAPVWGAPARAAPGSSDRETHRRRPPFR